jgi:hypothetical protein
MNADTERIRADANLAAIAARYGVKLRKSGKQLLGLCPFHRERTPSFYVHPAKQVFKCHGCGAGGDAFTFIQKIEGVDFRRALPILASLAGVPLSNEPWTPEQRREYVARQTERELLEHFRLREGIPDRESDRAVAAFQAECAADPEFEAWLRADQEHAQAITGAIVAILWAAQERDGRSVPGVIR